MADEIKTTTAKTESTASAPAAPAAAAATAPSVQNGKGDAPRNCFSESYRSNFDGIDWSK